MDCSSNTPNEAYPKVNFDLLTVCYSIYDSETNKPTLVSY